jgi:hypothetical protein
MKKIMKEQSTYSQYLKQENELTKLKIQAEFGFEVGGDNNLNPAIENLWLKQILEYERSMLNNKRITIGEKLGNPKFKPAHELSAEQISAELHSVMELLGTKNIVLDSVAGVPDSELYNFITGEFMEVETDSHSIPNMLNCFIYEEFHPNHEYDIKKTAEDFMKALENKTHDFSYSIHAGSRDEADMVKCDQLIRKLQLFSDAFDQIEVKDYAVKELIIREQDAELNFFYNLSVLPAESRKKHIIKGDGKITLKYSGDWWTIVDVEMNGVV